MTFLTERPDRLLFPTPDDGAVVDISPPGLAWLPAEGAAGYRVEMRKAGGDVVYEKETGADPVHLPDQALAPGAYTWDVIALDNNGKATARRGVQSFTVADGVPELPWAPPETLLSRVPQRHPRLLYMERDLPAVRATLGTTRTRTWAACLRAADRALDMPAPAYPKYQLTEDPVACKLEYKEYFAYLRGFVNNALMHLSLAFLMTEEAKYADAAKRILLEVTGWPTDDADVTSVLARWGDEPGLSMSRCAHRAYDWLYDALSDDERARVLKMCEARAWQTYRRQVNRHNYLTAPGESHAGRLIAYLSEMAIVMAGEAEGAGTWLDYSLKALTTFYPHWAGCDGGWAEGVGYGTAYNSIYAPALEGLRTACDFNLWQRPFFRKVRYFFFYCTAIRGEMRPFGDGADRGGPGTEGGGLANLLAHHAHLFDDPYIGWWVNQVKGSSGRSGELALMFEDEAPSKPPTDLPGSRLFRGVGWAGLHSDLGDPDHDTCMIFKSSPYGSVSHSHADQNAFAMMKGGKALAIPSGYYGPAYGQPHHAEWTRSTRANNCVLVNGEGQVIRDAKANGRIAAFEDRKGLTYLMGDAAPAYMGKLLRWDRHMLFLRPGLFLLLDDLEAPSASRYQWMLHALEEMALGEGQVISRRGGATLDVRLACPEGLTLSQTDRFDTPYNHGIPEQFHKDLPNHWHVTAETGGDAKAVRIGAAMGVYGAGEAFELETLSHDGWFGAKATGAFGAVEGWVQLTAGAPGPDGYSDAVADGRAKVCGAAMDGERFVV